MKKKRKVIIFAFIVCIVFIIMFLNKETLVKNVAIKAKVGETALINNNIITDNLIIPDKFNTGAKDTSNLTKVTVEGIFNNFQFKLSSTELVANWNYTNEQGKDYVLENYDFTNFGIRTYSSENISKNTTVTFNNCIFAAVKLSEVKSYNIKYIFNNCTFYSIASGSNAEFNNCRFASTLGDCTNAFANVNYNNCLLTEIPGYSTTGAHLDGIQLYGRENVKVEDVHMNNCRIIAPAIEPENSTSHVNACIMLKLDYNDADNVSFENMHINGGGYTIYSQPMAFKMTNISFKNISVGCTYRFGPLYKASLVEQDYGWNGAKHENTEETSNLYLGSVWKQNNSLHLSVTNDTNEEKSLKVVLSDGSTKQYTIPKCPKFKEFTTGMKYDDFPFDKEIVIDGIDSSYVQCYDGDTLIRTQVLSSEGITEKTLQSISMKSNPTKLEYIQNKETLDVTGGKITATYSDNSTQDIDITLNMVSGFDNSTIGSKEITVTYNEKTTTFNVNIVKNQNQNNTTENTTNNITGNTTENKTNNINVSKNSIVSENLATNILPRAGEKHFYIIISIIVVSLIAGICRYKYKKYNFK